MINLLSPEDKRQLRAARTNSLLLRYTILLGVLLLVLVAEMGGAYVVIANDKANNQAIIADNEAKTAGYNDTKKEAAAFATNLATAKYILGQQVPFTSIILRLAAALPPDAVVDKVSLDPATFGTPTTLTVHTVSYSSAVSLKDNLQKSGMFSDVSFQSVNEGEAKSHPYTVTLNVTYSKDLLKHL